MRTSQFITAVTSLLTLSLSAEVTLPSAFTDHMVLQRNQENPIWGWAEPHEELALSLAGIQLSTTADAEGNWTTKLPALPAGGPHTLRISGSSEVLVDDVLSGEVWLCSGQSNMQWPVTRSYGAEVEIVSANRPRIRFLTVSRNGTALPQENFDGCWNVCSPETVGDFSAIGYFYGKMLHEALDVPIGLIDNAWGGSSAESWVPRNTLESHERYQPMLAHWDKRVASFDEEAYKAYLAKYNAWVAEGRPEPALDWGETVHPATGQHRPANIFNGMVNPIAGYGMKGVIWYQGESNAARGEQYLHLFPLLVETWREIWGQGAFPFYWVQLADFGSEPNEPGEDSWAELRDAQTQAMDVIENSGQAVIIDIGEGRDIHPRDKKTVASRLVRWPLANDYGFDISYLSPRYREMQTDGNRIRIKFDHLSDQGLYAFDTKDIQGFCIAGADKKFIWAEAKIVAKDTVEVWAQSLEDPVAVRYGWAKNPVVNLYDGNGLPVTPFRTDNWQWLSVGKVID
ncbi:sialate O-acetylesterase [Puniceicoccaceae bacterium K14]|nr:sialate O-acetylesterase [Puniceicoccaceae bacterium K14]